MRQRIPATLTAILITLVVFVASAPTALAQNIMTARQALDGVENGSTILVDIRSRQEWRETGIASVAIPLSMHEPGFFKGINKLQSENPNKTIALICAVGGRTAYMNELLSRQGFENISDVSEGMFGGKNGTGWIPSGLPVKAWTGE